MQRRYLPVSRGAWLAAAVVAVVGLAVGIGVGRAHAYNQSVGGMTAAFGGIVFVAAGFGLLVFAIVTWILARTLRLPRGVARRTVAIAAVALVAGFPVGLLTAEATGGTYHDPVIPGSSGTVNAALSMPGAAFVPRRDGPADCLAGSDGTSLGYVMGLDLGELAGATLRGVFTWEPGASTASAELVVDAADVPDGVTPAWSGSGTLRDLTLGGLGATVVLERLTPVADPKLPTTPEWSAEISGTVTWTCGVLS